MGQWLNQFRGKSRAVRSQRQQWLYMFFGPGLAAAGLGVALTVLGAWSPLERGVYTRLFSTREQFHPIGWDDNIVVIAIDDASLQEYGSYPWSRDLYAELLYRLEIVQPAAVGFDILMPEATPEDAAFAEALTYNPYAVLAVGGDNQGKMIDVTESITQPAEGFFSVGHVKHITDVDGISRRAFLYERHSEGVFDSLAIALLRQYYTSLEGTINSSLTTELDPPTVPPQRVEKFERLEAFDQNKPIWINWPGPITSDQSSDANHTLGLTILSFQEVMNNDDVLAQLQNKIILVGYTATGVVGNIEDPIKTPFSRKIPDSGVHLHAALLDNLLNDRFLKSLPYSWALILTVVCGVGSSLVIRPLKLRGRLLFIVGLIPAWFAVIYGCFVGAGLVLPMAAPVGTTFLGLLLFQIAEQRERQALTELFAISLSPEMADFVWQHKDELLTEGQIHSQELTATLLFSDIRGFTTITEILPSAVLLSWLNRYFEVMTECIMDHGGVVDKYIGDAIMAAFGAPVARIGEDAIQQDALNAVKASVAMAERLKDLNQEFKAQGLPTVKFGVGLHTGALVAGTVGSRTRANYSLFGDTVNIAARLQDMTKTLTKNSPYPILMSETTYQYVADHCTISAEKAQIQLRGRTATTTVYALSGIKPSEDR
ncbi:CHASE2 domain-containing protein [Leptothoe sp. PORK10 BA2]|uniref:CHASE2 domain-containing protein n=1 Tax=Leptothoe sp. PORK10 BA2 TaxID=3110254 RepID=UPI002B1EAD6C|nr:adenylate/guanylate cyclase domain-containing protein [Leptothoe sp. PORK10 BA2]MEA5466180.1 adenylate/guanylate cyclase domain-containing protein [Leptothoe sp. PORK10 BA2]